MSQSNSTNKTDKVLNSLEGIQQATVPDFFYTRLQARMEKELMAEKPAFVLLRPSFIVTGLTLVCLVNLLLLLGSNSNQHFKMEQRSGIENFASEYNLSGTGQLYE